MPTEPEPTTEAMDLVGGDLAFDYANTASDRGEGGPRVERLRAYADVVTFARRTGVLDSARARELVREGMARPGDAAGVLQQAVALREAIYRIFSGVAGGVMPEQRDVALLNAFLAAGVGYRQLGSSGEGWVWRWTEGAEPLAQMLWPIAHAAAEQLVTGDPERVKLCGNDTCAWLFLDVSRNRSRRWCDMKDCGNRAKARRHYARRKESAPP